MIDLQKIAESLITDLMVQKEKSETEAVVCQVRVEGIRMYHKAIMDAITNDQKEAEVAKQSDQLAQQAPADIPPEAK